MRQTSVVKSPSRLERLKKGFDPSWVVNLCFVIVLVCSTLLTWREVVVLRDAYIASERNALDNVSNELDRQLQVGVDRLIFFRNGMQGALQTPLAFEVLRNVQGKFEGQRMLPDWQIELDNRRTLPLYGVSDYSVDQSPLLSRDNELLHNELTAALELGYLFRLASTSVMRPRQAWYVSRAGFYLSTNPVTPRDTITREYYQLLTRAWFSQQREARNTGRGVRWFTDQAHQAGNNDAVVTASVPLDYQNYWYGVLAMSFTVTSLRQILVEARQTEKDGDYQLYDSQWSLLASSLSSADEQLHGFTPDERHTLNQAMSREMTGWMRVGARFVSWEKLRHFEGVMLRVHTLREGLGGDFGSISIALALLWLLFTCMLLIAWGVIRRMVSNMYRLQHTLQWQAWYDPLTRLPNRGALFERAKVLSAEGVANQLPFSVIQIDLDHFKHINDRYGHQAGDLVLSHAARLIGSSLREPDMAGRVGGEEFCVLLPGSTLEEAARIAERIRARISGKEILVTKSQTIRISASFGVSSAQETSNYDFQYLQSVADSRLYVAKRSGRNQVCAQDASSAPPSM
ncbi:cellulose biosynthesis regulator YedQ [Yokenella regensburgei]|uniref:cellulose biosynthesis regulator diguanylate cyclase DgcQ n=1 Tax=Yokenella regensburgei TaxID=158877 RepID=UPI003F17A75A